MTSLLDRVAGAPITWGVCEVPGWGHQLSRDRVLGEMRRIGLRATELGPAGFLPTEPDELKALLGANGLMLVAGFVPATLHVPERVDAELAEVRRQASLLADGGADVLVLAATTGVEGYESTHGLDERAWATLVASLEGVAAIASDLGLMATLHPHVGTVIEQPREVGLLLERSAVPLCLDTGHLLVGGGDPVALGAAHADRIAHVHLKDVDAGVAAQVRDGSLGYRDAVARGLYRPLGRGSVDVGALVSNLEAAGYRGWYVLEHDTVLEREPDPGDGPVADASSSLSFLRGIAEVRTEVGSTTTPEGGDAESERI